MARLWPAAPNLPQLLAACVGGGPGWSFSAFYNSGTAHPGDRNVDIFLPRIEGKATDALSSSEASISPANDTRFRSQRTLELRGFCLIGAVILFMQSSKNLCF